MFCPGQKFLNLLTENELSMGKVFKCSIHIHTMCIYIYILTKMYFLLVGSENVSNEGHENMLWAFT